MVARYVSRASASLLLALGLALAGPAGMLYKPLSKSEKKTFQATAKAFRAAYAERNFEAINRFGATVLETYAPIELDPECRELRPLFAEIRSIIESAQTLAALDSLAAAPEDARDRREWKTCMVSYQPFLAYLERRDMDSLFQVHYSRLLDCQKNLLRETRNLKALSGMAQLKYYDHSLWQRQNKSIQTQAFQEFFAVSASMNRDSLLAFRGRYPDLFTQDIQTLLEKTRQKHRLSVLRNPSKDGITGYYAVYPDRDPALDKLLEQSLFRAFQARPSPEAANKYLLSFPEGPGSPLVKDYLRIAFMDSLSRSQSAAASDIEGNAHLNTPALPEQHGWPR